MPGENDTHRMTFNGWEMRIRHATQQPIRLLLLLHGWTGDENSMWIFTSKAPENAWIVSPRAPHTAKEGGFSWRELLPGTWGLPTLSDLKPAADSLIQLADDLSSSVGFDATHFDVAGFSQGGALTNVLALLYPERIRTAAVLAGFMPGGTDNLLQKRVIAGKPFFVAHGSQDNLVSMERAQGSVRLLEEAGARVTFCESDVGHKVSADCLHGLQDFWGRV